MVLLRIDQHLTLTPAAHCRTDHAQLLQLIHQPRRPRVTDAQPALQHRSAGALALAHDLDRLLHQAIPIGQDLLLAIISSQGEGSCFFGRRQALLPEGDHPLDLLVADHHTLQAHAVRRRPAAGRAYHRAQAAIRRRQYPG